MLGNFTIAFTVGAWGGFYVDRHRICLGWLAITWFPFEVADAVDVHLDMRKLTSFKPGHFVSVDCPGRYVGTGIVDSIAEPFPLKVGVRLSNGNVWWYPVRSVERCNDSQEIDAFQKRSEFKVRLT